MRHAGPVHSTIESRLELAAAPAAEALVVPGGDFLLQADFARDGVDLVLTGAQGERVVIAGYFAGGTPATLATAGGAQLTPDLVKLLAVDGAAFAQAAAPGLGAAIGQVRNVTGSVSVTHSDGTTATLQVGDPVYRSDVVRTEGGSNLGIVFADGTNFSLGAGARMVLNELVYGGGAPPSMTMSVLQGSFVFLTGQVSKEGGTMEVRTPVATIGIRGTTVAGNLDVEGSNGQFTLLPDPDGRVGVVEILNNGGQVTLTQALQTTQVIGFNTPPGAPLILSQGNILQLYGLALDSHGALIGQPPLPPSTDPERRGDIDMNQIGRQLAQIAPAAGDQGQTDGSLSPMTPWQNAPLVVTALDLRTDTVTTIGNDLVVVSTSPTSTQIVVVPQGALPAVVSNVFTAPAGGGVVTGTDGDDTLIGGAGDDTLIGGPGDDVLIGGAGNNLLEGDQGNDTVLGGSGNDTIVGGHGEGDDVYNGGGGVNTVTYTSANLPIQVDLAAGTASGDPAIGVDALTGIQNVGGGSGNDTLLGDSGANFLRGGLGDDLLVGRGGDDSLDGGTGRDTASFAGSIANYAITLNGDGTASVRSLSTAGPFAEGLDRLVNVEALRFADDDIVIDGSNQAPVAAGFSPDTTITLQGTLVAHDFGDIPPLILPPDGAPLPPAAINGVGLASVTLQHDHVVNVTFVGESAGFQNTLGWYAVAPDGSFGEAHLLFPNASAVGEGGSLVPGQSTVSLGTVAAGNAIGFFVIANGFSLNSVFHDENALANGQLNFQLNGENASLNGVTGRPSLIFTSADGTSQTILGDIYHSIANANGPFGNTLALNSDGVQHFVSGTLGGEMAMAVEDTRFLGVQVEDLPGGGDRDFNDLAFRVDIAPALVLNGETSVALAPTLTVSDVDGRQLSGASIQLTEVLDAQDRLGFIDGWSLAGGHLVRPDGVDSGIAATLSGGNLTLSGVATHDAYQAALRAIAFIDGGAATLGDRTASIQVQDELGRASTAVDVHVSLAGPTDSQGQGFSIAPNVMATQPLADQPHVA